MKLEMRSHGVELTSELRRHIERKLRFALTRFRQRLRRVHVLVTDVNGPRGGDDIHCKVRVELGGRGELVVREVDSDPFAAVARAIERVTRTVARRTGRLAHDRRGRGRHRPSRRS